MGEKESGLGKNPLSLVFSTIGEPGLDHLTSACQRNGNSILNTGKFHGLAWLIGSQLFASVRNNTKF